MDMDLLQGVQEGMDAAPGEAGGMPDMGDFQLPSMEKMLEIIETLDMPDADKAELKESLLSKGDFMSKMAEMGAAAAGGGGGGGARPGYGPPPVAAFDPTTQYMVFFAAVIIIATLLGLFGYKLYKSMAEKERKREEKKQQKQQKKKK